MRVTSLRQRFDALPAGSPADRLALRGGSMRDYRALARFHYLRNAPATATRILTLEDRRPTVIGRYVGRAAEQQTVGVLVESLPALACTLRDEATGGRYRALPDRRMRARLLNAELRCISRVVVHPQWRGLGLAVRLVRRALATMTTPLTEALAAMGRVHPFFERAGMTAYRRWPHRWDQRLRDAMRFAGIEPWELASAGRLRDRLRSGSAEAELFRRELRRWAGRRLPFDQQLALGRDRLLCEPVYYLAHRDGPTGPPTEENHERDAHPTDRAGQAPGAPA